MAKQDQEHGSQKYQDFAYSYKAPASWIAPGAVIPGNACVKETSTGLNVAGVNDSIYGINRRDIPFPGPPSENFLEVGLLRVPAIADVPMALPSYFKAAAAGRIGPYVTTALAGSTIPPGAQAGLGFANQPLNDSVDVLSSSAGDTTQVVTIYGTTTATNTVVKQTVALNGTTPVTSAKVDWGQILGVSLSAACVGTVTIRKTTGSATIKTIAPAALSVGIVTITAPGIAYNTPPTVVASGASTKQVGLVGTDATGALLLDSVPLNGATPVTMNSSFQTVQSLLVGDVALATNVTLSVGAADPAERKGGKILEAAAVAGALIHVLCIPG